MRWLLALALALMVAEGQTHVLVPGDVGIQTPFGAVGDLLVAGPGTSQIQDATGLLLHFALMHQTISSRKWGPRAEEAGIGADADKPCDGAAAAGSNSGCGGIAVYEPAEELCDGCAGGL